MAMHSYRVDDQVLINNVAEAFSAKRAEVTIPLTFYTIMVDGILASDAELNVRIDVTMAERASGAFKGEGALDIAIRETRETVADAATQIADKVMRATEFQNELYAFMNMADGFMTSKSEEEQGKEFWRIRSLVREIRDVVSDNPRTGVRINGVKSKDLLSYEAWAPFNADEKPDELRVILMNEKSFSDRAVKSRLSALADQLAVNASGTPVAWRDLTANDIAGMTDDHTTRHLLLKAAELRDEAVAVAGGDPEKARKILADVHEIENSAMESAMKGLRGDRLSRLETVTEVLKDRSEQEIRK